MSAEDSPVFRLYRESEDPALLAAQIRDLRDMVIHLAQDLAALRSMLDEQGLWNEVRFRQLRVERMIEDHVSAGPAPWEHYSWYPYTLDEHAFLYRHFGASEETVRWFDEQVDLVRSQT